MRLVVIQMGICALVVNLAFAADNRNNLGAVARAKAYLRLGNAGSEPKDFMYRLRQAEAQQNINNKQAFNEPEAFDCEALFLGFDGQDYRSYFVALAQSTLGDAEKLQEIFTVIPPIQELDQGHRRFYRSKLLGALYELKKDAEVYPITRLLIAAYIHTQTNVHPNYFMSHAFYNTDNALMEFLRARGALSPKQGLFFKCNTVQQFKLLVAHGAQVEKVYEEMPEFPISYRLFDHATPDLIAFLLARRLPDISVAFQKRAYVILVENNRHAISENFETKLQLLLDCDCYYDEEELADYILHSGYVGNRVRLYALLKKALVADQKKKKRTIVRMLAKREMTGKSSHFKKLHMVRKKQI